MLFARYSFHCELKEDAILPVFKGSTFRGAFGHALKNVTCALKHEECGHCLVRDRCVYSVVFETQRPSGKLGPSPCHPFVIEPPESPETFLAKGQDFDFGLLLFGRANDYLPYFVYALEQMGKIGLGRKTNGRRGGYRLERMSSDGSILYEASSNTLLTTVPRILKLTPVPETDDVHELQLELTTPLRFNYENRLFHDLPFHVLIRTALRRIADLNNHWGEGEPDIDYQGMVHRSLAVRTSSSKLRWMSVRRYSTRQQTSVSLGGVIGSVTYAGEITEFLPLLRYCEAVHLGKATAFGFGKILLVLPPKYRRASVSGDNPSIITAGSSFEERLLISDEGEG